MSRQPLKNLILAGTIVIVWGILVATVRPLWGLEDTFGAFQPMAGPWMAYCWQCVVAISEATTAVNELVIGLVVCRFL